MEDGRKEGGKDMDRGERGRQGEARRGWSTKRAAHSLSLALSVFLLVRPSLTRSVGSSVLCLIECGCSTCTPHTHRRTGIPKTQWGDLFLAVPSQYRNIIEASTLILGSPVGCISARAPRLPAYKWHHAALAVPAVWAVESAGDRERERTQCSGK